MTSSVPTGKITITGEILTIRWDDNDYGSTEKMLVKADGYKVWGSVPKSLHLLSYDVKDNGQISPLWDTQRDPKRGDIITFTATVEASEKDQSFGFFKRPTKASYVN